MADQPKKPPSDRPHAKCPVCGKMAPVKDGKLSSHGPGKDSFFCPGGGKPVTQST